MVPSQITSIKKLISPSYEIQIGHMIYRCVCLFLLFDLSPMMDMFWRKKFRTFSVAFQWCYSGISVFALHLLLQWCFSGVPLWHHWNTTVTLKHHWNTTILQHCNTETPLKKYEIFFLETYPSWGSNRKGRKDEHNGVSYARFGVHTKEILIF